MHDFQIEMTASNRPGGARDHDTVQDTAKHDTIGRLHNADLVTLDAGFAPLQLVA